MDRKHAKIVYYSAIFLGGPTVSLEAVHSQELHSFFVLHWHGPSQEQRNLIGKSSIRYEKTLQSVTCSDPLGLFFISYPFDPLWDWEGVRNDPESYGLVLS